MPLPDWTKTEDWDALYLGGRRVPGVATVQVKLGGGIDTKKSKGRKRSKPKDVGIEPARLEIEMELQPSEIEAFETFVRVLRPIQRGTPREPIEITHPQARLWGINVVLIGDIEVPHPGPGGDLFVSFVAIEWAKPDKVKKASDKPKSEGDYNVPSVDQELENLSLGVSGAAASNFADGNYSDPDLGAILVP